MLLVPAALAIAAPGAARAQDSAFAGITPGDPSAATTEQPLELSIETTLQFDRIIVDGTGSGAVRLQPDGMSQLSGGIESLGGRTMVGRLVIRGAAGRAIMVDFPRHLELSSISGGTIDIDEVVTDLPHSPALDGSGQLVVNFGGVLTIDGDVDGDFRGNLLIRADYL